MSKPASSHAEHLSAPREHQGVLIEPPLTPVQFAALRPDSRLAPPPMPDVRILDGSVAEFRIGLAEQFGLVPARAGHDGGPVIVAGHQAEFVHAGILAKTIAGDLVAERSGGLAVFLLVDSDTPKASHVRIPVARGEALEVANIPIPGI